MKKKITALLLTATMIAGATMTTHTATPLYKPLSAYGYTGVPKITVKLSPSVEKAVEKAAAEAVKNL